MPEPPEPGDAYIRRTATFIRTHEAALAQGGLVRRRRVPRTTTANSDAQSILNPLSWFGSGSTPQNVNNGSSTPAITYTTDTARLFYLLVRLEALSLPVGSLDVHVSRPSRPMSYIDVPSLIGADKEGSDAKSLAISFRSSLSGISKLSLGGSMWSSWGAKAEQIPVEAELKFIYSSFNRLPALALRPPNAKSILDPEAGASPNALPMDVFRTVEVLDISDVDPRTLLGWDRLAMGLRALSIKRSGVEDLLGDVFVKAVIEDKERRDGTMGAVRGQHRQVGSEGYVKGVGVPDTVHEEDEIATPTAEAPLPLSTPSASEYPTLPNLSWAFLLHLSLSDNSLTFIPSSPLSHLTSLTHLDLSSNLLVSVPPGLSALHNLSTLELSDNMIDSVLGIYTQLGQILTLRLARNRLESLCGLERLRALEHIDISHNLVDEAAEVGRLSTLPNITTVNVAGNPLVEIEDNWRIAVFGYFWTEGHAELVLDGAPPSILERRYMTATSPAPMQDPMHVRSRSAVAPLPSPPVLPVGSIKAGAYANANGTSRTVPAMPESSPSPSGPSPSPGSSQPASVHASPALVGVSKVKRKKPKRVVNLEGGDSPSSGPTEFGKKGHRRVMSDGGEPGKVLTPVPRSPRSPPRRVIDLGSPPSSPMVLPASSPPPVAPTATATSPSSAQPQPTPSPAPKPVPVRKVSRHGRHMTEFSPSPSSSSGLSPPPEDSDPSPLPSSPSYPTGSATLGRTQGRSSKRRARVSASVFEPGPDDSTSGAGNGNGLGNGVRGEVNRQNAQADAYRARIEALRNEVGEGWLKVFSQSGLGSPASVGGGARGS